MTLFGWDTSHFDGTITLAAARSAAKAGIVFATAKVGEGRSYDDPLDGTNLANLRDGGIRYLGGYHVVRTDAVQPQIDNLIRLADRDESWWRDWPYWAWQVDLEKWSYDPLTASTGIEFGRRLRDQTGCQVIMYASRGQYADQLSSWDGPLWNADYPSTRTGAFDALYPGDGYKGWAAYSGKAPDLLQYASSATIGGMTTCDANAFRGDLAALHALWTGGTMPVTPEDVTHIWQHYLAPNGANMQDHLLAAESAAGAAATGVQQLLARPAGAVALSDADRVAIVAELVKHLPTAAQIAKAVNDDAATRLAQ